MKSPGQTQTKDGAVDKLIRAYVSRPSNVHQTCPDFDPDRANAYIERRLTPDSRSQYEAHLSECAPCRKGVVALARLADAEQLTRVSPGREAARSTWLSGARWLFGALSQPQWAMAAAAVIVLAISLPILLSRNQGGEGSQPVVASNQPQSESPATLASNSAPSDTTPSLPPAARLREKAGEQAESTARNAPAAPRIESPTGAGAPAGFLKKPEVADAVQPTDEQRRSEAHLAQAPGQGGAAPVSQNAKSDSESRQQQPENSVKVTSEAEAVRAHEAPANKEEKKKAEDAAAPPPSPAASPDVARSRAGGGLRQPGKLSLRDSAPGEAVRADERRFNGKKFLFRDGAWTDKEFDPNKDLPVVTIIRDSNVYKDLLSKRAGLKSIMDRFAATERAIVVYKGTVYKLIPQ